LFLLRTFLLLTIHKRIDKAVIFMDIHILVTNKLTVIFRDKGWET